MADEEFARQAAQAGLHTLYLPVDGTSTMSTSDARETADEVQAAVVENCRSSE
jgi:uncharacterized radical SAM superfamily Fe-S cluster-containing enzyme